MSLLMDALKKAEQDKKEAAKRLKEAQDQSSDEMAQTQELSTDDTAQPMVDSAPADEDRDKPDVKTSLDELSLSPVEDQQLVVESVEDYDSLLKTPEFSAPSYVPSPSDSSSSPEENEKLPTTDKLELEIGEATEGGILPTPNQTFTLTDIQVEEESVASTEDTIQAKQEVGSETIAEPGDEYEYFSAKVSAAQLAQDIGSYSPTPVAAQTVFTATVSKPGNTIFQWGIFVTLCIVIIASLSFFIFNYTVPVERTIKSPLVARNIETQSEPVPTIEIPEELVSSTEVDTGLFTGEITDVIEKENSTVVAEEDQAATAETDMDQLAMAQEKIWTPSEDDSSAAQIVKETLATLPEKIILEPQLIKISRSTSVDKRSLLINKAYQEYLVGDYGSAETSYRNVLKELPENRDALLGLAAISVRNGNLRQAYAHYLEVLKLYPGDSVSEAALINFKLTGDYSRNESILKTFLQREPDNSFLYYSLGRLYASQTRWPEAQQSFFDAHRIETSNPDYAYNLAVSLDHIGKKQSAVDYYNVALELAGQSTAGFTAAGFDRAIVVSRINALSNLATLE